MNIDSILTEWSYRLPSGYPTKSKDYELLYHVILEMTDCSPLVARNIVNKAQGLNEAEGEDNLIDFTQLNLPENLQQQVEERYANLSSSEQEEFNKNYRKHSIQSYMNTGYKPFTKFYDILPTGKSAGGMGKGEIQVLLAVADSQPGGTASHDIVMSNGQWEVKEVGKLPTVTKAGVLGKTPDSKTFRPAKAGMPIEGDLLTYTLTFFNEIVRPLANMGDSFEELKELQESDLYLLDGIEDRNATSKGTITTNFNLLKNAGIEKIHFNIPKLEGVIGYESDDKNSLRIWNRLQEIENFEVNFIPKNLTSFLELDSVAEIVEI